MRRIAKMSRAVLAGAAVAVLGVVARAGTKPVSLPYNFTDSTGSAWMLYANGMLQGNGGQNPSFSQLGQMQLNGANNNAFVRNGQVGKQDEKTGEILLENMNMGGLTVTRRILPSKEDGTIRYIDTFHNPGAKEAVANVTYHANFNFGITASRTVNDPKKKDQALGWAGQTGNNRGVFLCYALEGAKVAPKVNYPEGSNQLIVTFAVPVPAGGDAALVHVHGSTDTIDKAAEMISGFKAAKLLAGVDAPVRRSIVNSRVRTGFGEELEILRGDTLDVIETRSGDALRGTLKDASYPLKTSFGRVELAAEKVLAVLSVGRNRPMQLLLTVDGEVFGGAPEREYLTLQLSSGQTVKVPVGQVSRAGYRRKPNEPEEVSLSKPAVMLRTGERIAIAPLGAAIDVATRFGVIKLNPATIASITLKSEEASVHQVVLTDGTKLSGLLTAPSLEVTLDGAAGNARLSLAMSSIAKVRPTPAGDPDAAEAEQPEVRCTGDDVLHGVIEGTFSVDTAFESVTIRGDQVRRIAHANANSPELQVTLWDQTLLTGTATTATLPVKLVSGPTLVVPLDLLETYTNNAPKPSDDATVKVKELVAQLNSDDFKARETAQAALVATGNTIVPLLRELKAGQPAEAQQRIDQILAQLEK